MRAAAVGVAVVGTAVLAISLTDARNIDRPPASAARPPTADTARLLEVNRTNSAQLVRGSIIARLRELKGVPVVVNAWASWCGPCRQEFPLFERFAQRYRDQIAFVGLNSEDSRGRAQAFLRKFPVPYPSISDPEGDQVRAIGGGGPLPASFFYDRGGRQTYFRLGVYATRAELSADINRYALGAQTN